MLTLTCYLLVIFKQDTVYDWFMIAS